MIYIGEISISSSNLTRDTVKNLSQNSDQSNDTSIKIRLINRSSHTDQFLHSRFGSE